MEKAKNNTKINSMKATLKNNEKFILGIVFIGVLIDIFFFQNVSDLRTFFLMGIYIFSLWYYKLKSKLTLLFCFILLAIIFIQFLFSEEGSNIGEKAASWLVLFLVVSIIQQWRE